MRIAIAAENAAFENGSVAASPWMTAAFEPFTDAPSLAANAWSYSRLVTRFARRPNSSVAAPGPAPNSSTCPPSSEPCKIHGNSCRRVTHRQNRDPQNHVSYAFIENSTEFEENFNLADVPSAKFRFDDPADNLQRPTVFIMYSGYRSPAAAPRGASS